MARHFMKNVLGGREMWSDYVATSTTMVRRALAGPALRFAEDVPTLEDRECFGRLAGAGVHAWGARHEATAEVSIAATQERGAERR